MEYTEREQLHHVGAVQFIRDIHGIPHIEAENERDLFFGLGYAHAKDRGMQLLLMRVLGKGQGSEFLQASEEMLQIDLFFRRMNWNGDTKEVLTTFDERTRNIAQSYADGINHALKKKMPWELRLLRYKPTPWLVTDSILIGRMMGYISLQGSQAEVERLLVEMIQAGVPEKHLSELFQGKALSIDYELLSKVRLEERMVPPHVLWGVGIPKVMASNNWAVSPKKSASGKTILASDPHLEINRIPNVWQEVVLKTKDRFLMGATVPGLPGVMIGRNNDVAWGATYSFMDAVDSWIEDCREGKFRRGTANKIDWVKFKERREIIRRKGKKDHIATFYENEHGVLDGDPHQAGLYLATRWASGTGMGLKSIRGVFDLLNIQNVKEGMKVLGELELSFNWVLSDNDGNIGYQMSGLCPKRKASWNGLVPQPGWDSTNDWKGFATIQDLPHAYNPKEGYLVTANNDLNHLGKIKPINMPMGSYRASRISDLLERKTKLSTADMQDIQYDVYSLQAEKFMKIIFPLLGESEHSQILRTWDCRYGVDSKGAFLFEKFYQILIKEVFGPVMGTNVVDHLLKETGILVDFYENFDLILCAKKSVWFAGKPRDDIYKAALKRLEDVEIGTWGEMNSLSMTHILFNGKLPKFLKLDFGPVPLPGGRATPSQGQIYRSANRVTSFFPSYRMVVDFAKDTLESALCGGATDRPWSRWYFSDLHRWMNKEFKTVSKD